MITAGIDMGAKNIKVVLLRDGEVLARSSVVAGFDTTVGANEAMAAALGGAGIERTEVARVVATGAGREEAPDKE